MPLACVDAYLPSHSALPGKTGGPYLGATLCQVLSYFRVTCPQGIRARYFWLLCSLGTYNSLQHLKGGGLWLLTRLQVGKHLA